MLQLAVACLIGLLLPHVAELPEATRTADGVTASEAALDQLFDDDGWLIVLGGIAGLVLGVALQWWRRGHEVVTLVAIVVFSLLAARLAGWIAEGTGPGDPVGALAEAAVGSTAPMPVEISSQVAYLVWPLMSVVGAVMVLLSVHPPGSPPSHPVSSEA